MIPKAGARMVKLSTPNVTVSGTAKPEKIYVQLQGGTAVMSSSDRLTIRGPLAPVSVVEVRENTSETINSNR